MKLCVAGIIVIILAVSGTAGDEDFRDACAATINSEKAIAFERCLKEQSAAFLKVEALIENGHKDVVQQCLSVDRKLGTAVGEPKKYTDWRRVEACTRAYL